MVLGVDARMSFEVTERDIREGSRGDSVGCPIALALSRDLGRPVRVGSDRIVIDASWWNMDDFVHHWVCDFDDGLVCLPIRIRLTAQGVARSDS